MNFRKLGILVVVFIGVAWVLSTPLQLLGRPLSYRTPPHSDERLDAPQMNEFLRLWSIYLHKFGQEKLPPLSLENKRASASAPWRLKLWLYTEGWDVDRFFFVEDRLHSIVKTAYNQRNIAANKQLKEQNAANKTALSEIIQRQEKSANPEGITPEELALVKDNLDKVIGILQGSLAYKP